MISFKLGELEMTESETRWGGVGYTTTIIDGVSKWCTLVQIHFKILRVSDSFKRTSSENTLSKSIVLKSDFLSACLIPVNRIIFSNQFRSVCDGSLLPNF